MGETGVPGMIDQVQTAQTVVEERTAIIETPAPVAAAPVVEQQAMGAAPAPEAPRMVAKADRN